MIETADMQVFLNKVKPELEQLEGIRIKKLAEYQFRRMAGIIGGLISLPFVALIDWWMVHFFSDDKSGFGLTFIVLGGIWWWVTDPRRQYAKVYKTEILPCIAKMFGSFSYNADGKIPMEELKSSKIIPNHDRYKSEDYFEGLYKGTKIRFAEIELAVRRRSGKRTHYVTVFKGLVVLISMKRRKFTGHTILIKNANKLFQWFTEKTDGLKRADLVDPVFEKMFDVFTNDQVEARYLVDPKIIERYKSMAANYNSEGISAAYYGGNLLVLIPLEANLFEPAGLETRATDFQAVIKMKQEVESILYVIDELELYSPEEDFGAGTASGLGHSS